MNLDHTDPALSFLTASPRLLQRKLRWKLETVLFWSRLTETCIVFLVGILVSAALASPHGGMKLHWGVLAATLGTVAALELGRAAGAVEGRRWVAAQAAAAGAAGGLALAGLGAVAQIALLWAIADTLLLLVLLFALASFRSRLVAGLAADGRLARQIAVVGTGPTAAHAVARLGASDPRLFQVAGSYTLEPAQIADGATFRGDLRTLLCDARLELIDDIVLALEPDDDEALTSVRKLLKPCIQDVYVLDGVTGMVPPGAHPAKFGVLDLRLIQQLPIKGSSAFAKRLFDLVGSGILLALMAPLLVSIAAVIKLESRGPVLFRQLRVGYNNQLFYILKFRSMYYEATDRLAKQQTVRGDKRVTRIGRIIRRLSLDELPQLLNVVRGEMSLVGPRPHAPGTSIGGRRVHTLVEGYGCRHLIRPGITGLAQVRGLRGGLHDRQQVSARIESDLEYIETWSLWLDLRILFGTVVMELRDSRGS